jgi:hypothetical protein
VTVQGLLVRLVAALENAEIPYMLTGSYASSLHSIPRATRDIDIIIFPNRDQLTRFVQSLPPDSYHADLPEAIEALRRRSQFNVIDYATGWKVDFIIPSFEEFHQEEFDRRRVIEADGVKLSVVSPEDIILSKLRWAKLGESERQIEDAATVIRLQGSALDMAYIEKWVRKLEIEPQWHVASAKAAAG